MSIGGWTAGVVCCVASTLSLRTDISCRNNSSCYLLAQPFRVHPSIHPSRPEQPEAKCETVLALSCAVPSSSLLLLSPGPSKNAEWIGTFHRWCTSINNYGEKVIADVNRLINNLFRQRSRNSWPVAGAAAAPPPPDRPPSRVYIRRQWSCMSLRLLWFNIFNNNTTRPHNHPHLLLCGVCGRSPCAPVAAAAASAVVDMRQSIGIWGTMSFLGCWFSFRWPRRLVWPPGWMEIGWWWWWLGDWCPRQKVAASSSIWIDGWIDGLSIVGSGLVVVVGMDRQAAVQCLWNVSMIADSLAHFIVTSHSQPASQLGSQTLQVNMVFTCKGCTRTRIAVYIGGIVSGGWRWPLKMQQAAAEDDCVEIIYHMRKQ